jgi:GT2 family glycosyltransferase
VPELAFVVASGGNWFFDEMVAAIRQELDRQGVPSSVHQSFPPQRDDRVYVFVAPHEYVLLHGHAAVPPGEVLARTIVLSTEQPGSFFFGLGVEISECAAATFDINSYAVESLVGAGVAARHLQLGYTPQWDRFDPDRERDIDVLFLGNGSPRRLRHLASYGRQLTRWNSYVRISDNTRPNAQPSASFLTDEKWDLLSRSKVMINLHAGERPYFEWLRVVQAVHCGAVVVSEHSVGLAPLEPGKHLFIGSPESLGLISDALLRDDPTRERVRDEAHRLLRDSLPLARSVGELVGVARMLVATPKRGPFRSLRVPVTSEAEDEPPPDDDLAAVRAGIMDARLDMVQLRRGLARLQRSVQYHGEEPPEITRVGETTAWRGRRYSTVTVLTALYNHGDVVGQALDSLQRSRLRDFELVVVDDGSTDDSGELALSWMRAHDEVPARLVRHEVNRGLGAARNTALDFARSRYCFVLDSDNEVYPRCLDRLVSALDNDAEATFAYPLLEVFGNLSSYIAAGGSPLINAPGWDPNLLRLGNYIDAMALIRTAKLAELGGFRTDPRLHGWEDYDLWCRIAERGGRGIQVPQILARYRSSRSSLRSIVDLSKAAPLEAIIEASPNLMAGVTAHV